jgi:tetratricopeptide (TPR) repeat protein
MATTLNPSEEAQLTQTVEMFEVITQSQPHDYQSLEILKEAYTKLGREKDVVGTSKRIAQAYVQMGQLSSAILEYETILQRYPEDAEVQKALRQIETKANNFPGEPPPADPLAGPKAAPVNAKPTAVRKLQPGELEDGRKAMHKVFVEGKIITAEDFNSCWPVSDPATPAEGIVDPFIQILNDKKILPVERSLKILADKTRIAFLPLQAYDIDIDLARSFPATTCQRWCILPFDRMSKSILVATANPFNQEAARELSESTGNRLLWYLVSPTELVKNLRKAFR